MGQDLLRQFRRRRSRILEGFGSRLMGGRMSRVRGIFQVWGEDNLGDLPMFPLDAVKEECRRRMYLAVFRMWQPTDDACR